MGSSGDKAKRLGKKNDGSEAFSKFSRFRVTLKGVEDFEFFIFFAEANAKGK